MDDLSSDEKRVLEDAAKRQGMSLDAAIALYRALLDGNGRQAQFNHPELGGMGQWSQGGMIMIGDMFNNGLKHRIDGLCNELAGLARNHPPVGGSGAVTQSQSQGSGARPIQGSGARRAWWPAELGEPASVGAQNDMRYAYFPSLRRLAIEQSGVVRVYDSGDHDISGFSQQQGGGQSLTFNSQFGVVQVADLAAVTEADRPAAPSPQSLAPTAAAPQPAPRETVDIFTAIERLAELRQKNILTEEEFAAKKAELLSRI